MTAPSSVKLSTTIVAMSADFAILIAMILSISDGGFRDSRPRGNKELTNGSHLCLE